MGMRTWTVNGFGVLAEELENATTDNRIAFLKDFLPKEYNRMMDDLESEENIDPTNTADYIDFCKDWINNYEGENGDIQGIAGIFADAINTFSNGDVPVECLIGDYSDENAVLYVPAYPWHMSKRVKHMSENDMRLFFEKFLNKLGVSAKVDTYSVEFNG